MALTPDEREAFLADAHVAAISVIESGDRGPLTIPIWYLYAPGGDIRVRTRPDSRKARAINARGRVSLMVQTVSPAVRYVSVEGPVVATEPDTPELAREMAERYLPAERVDEFLAFERDVLGEHSVIRIRPERWLSAEMG